MATLLDKYIVIYKEQLKNWKHELHQTEISPIGRKERNQKSIKLVKPEHTGYQQHSGDMLYLGHITENHYVSLRSVTWKDQLFKSELVVL